MKCNMHNITNNPSAITRPSVVTKGAVSSAEAKYIAGQPRSMCVSLPRLIQHYCNLTGNRPVRPAGCWSRKKHDKIECTVGVNASASSSALICNWQFSASGWRLAWRQPVISVKMRHWSGQGSEPSRCQYITFPTNEASQQHVKSEFFDVAGFPNVLVCVDGTQIAITAPTTNEHIYVCRKGFHSMNIQAICDAKLRFTSIVTKYPGSTHGCVTARLCRLQLHDKPRQRVAARWQQVSPVTLPNDPRHQCNKQRRAVLQQVPY